MYTEDGNMWSMKMITLTTEVDFLIILKIKNKVQHSQKYAPQIFTILARVLKFVSVTQLLHEAVRVLSS